MGRVPGLPVSPFCIIYLKSLVFYICFADDPFGLIALSASGGSWVGGIPCD